MPIDSFLVFKLKYLASKIVNMLS